MISRRKFFSNAVVTAGGGLRSAPLPYKERSLLDNRSKIPRKIKGKRSI